MTVGILTTNNNTRSLILSDNKDLKNIFSLEYPEPTQPAQKPLLLVRFKELPFITIKGLSAYRSLTTLQISNNPSLINLFLNNLPALKTLRVIKNNQLKYLDLSTLNLKYLQITENKTLHTIILPNNTSDMIKEKIKNNNF